MSAAVMPMRKTVSAPAICGSPATVAIASIITAAIDRLFGRFFGTHQNKSLLDFHDYFLCNIMQRLCQWG